MKTQTVITSAVKTANLAGKLQVRLVAHCAMAHAIGKIEGITVKAVDELLKTSLTAYVGTRSIADYVKIGKNAAKSFDSQFAATIAAGDDEAGAVSESVGLIVAAWQADGLTSLSGLKERFAPAKGAPRGNTATSPVKHNTMPDGNPAPGHGDEPHSHSDAVTGKELSVSDIAARLAKTPTGIAAMVAALENAGYTVAAPTDTAETEVDEAA